MLYLATNANILATRYLGKVGTLLIYIAVLMFISMSSLLTTDQTSLPSKAKRMRQAAR